MCKYALRRVKASILNYEIMSLIFYLMEKTAFKFHMKNIENHRDLLKFLLNEFFFFIIIRERTIFTKNDKKIKFNTKSKK